MVCGIISLMAIIALAVIITYYCKEQPVKVKGFLVAERSQRFNKL
jgi:hypothetical protein